ILLGAALLLERFETTGRRPTLIVAGLLLGAAVLVKQTSAWAPAAALVWLLARSRRRSARAASVLVLSFAAPYGLFALSWPLLFRTKAHIFWSFDVRVLHPLA